jgi:hypothetical protein
MSRCWRLLLHASIKAGRAKNEFRFMSGKNGSSERSLGIAGSDVVKRFQDVVFRSGIQERRDS